MKFSSYLNTEQLARRSCQLAEYLESDEARAEKIMEKSKQIAIDIKDIRKSRNGLFKCIKVRMMWGELNEYRGAYHYYMGSAEKCRNHLAIYRKLIDDRISEEA